MFLLELYVYRLTSAKDTSEIEVNWIVNNLILY